MKITALIPARSNSERFPGKNYVDFFGKPLFVHSTDFARCCPLIDEYYVTTNDKNVIAICNERNIPYLERPDKYCTPTSNSSEYVDHFLKTQYLIKNELPDALLILQPTNPIREDLFVADMVDLYNQSKADCVFTVVKSKSKMGRIVDGRFLPFNYTFEQRSQDLTDYYEEKGILYLIRVASFLREGTLFGKINIPYVLPEKYGNLDIDTVLEKDIAELILQKHIES